MFENFKDSKFWKIQEFEIKKRSKIQNMNNSIIQNFENLRNSKIQIMKTQKFKILKN